MILNDIVVKPKKSGTEIEVVIPKTFWSVLKYIMLIFVVLIVIGGVIAYWLSTFVEKKVSYLETTTTTLSTTIQTTTTTVATSTLQSNSQTTESFISYENKEPYYSSYCDKINPYDLNVRKVASDAIRNHPGAYSIDGIDQLLDIYDWVKSNINYQSVPLNQYVPYPPAETLAIKSGDCKNQAVLIASMIESIGGTAKVIENPGCAHSYAIVYFTKPGSDMTSYVQTISNHYGGVYVYVRWYIDNQGIWVIVDPAGGRYPGDTLPECWNSNSVYTVTSCLDCVNQYPNKPYTFGDKCYAQCPSGTISVNNYACVSCPEGYYSFNNQCVTCPAGYYLATNGRCYPS